MFTLLDMLAHGPLHDATLAVACYWLGVLAHREVTEWRIARARCARLLNLLEWRMERDVVSALAIPYPQDTYDAVWEMLDGQA